MLPLLPRDPDFWGRTLRILAAIFELFKALISR
jgi:hypothetical protein